MAGERIGKYRVIARLGQGGMARVLLTMSEGPHGFNKLLVVKELREELADDPEFLAMFMDEARIAARLNHPNIVQTYEVGQDDNRHFLAMEYLEGQPLNAIYRRLGRKAMALEIHLRILSEVLCALGHAHALADFDGSPLHIVHRDVSPQNVFVTYEGQVKLVDFGIAKSKGASSRTQEGILKGKISYLSPEQARCDAVDHRADLFTIGIMLWEILAGRRMVQREDEASVLARRMSGQDPKIRTVVPDLPTELAAICDKATAFDRNERYQSAAEFQEVLEGYIAKSDFRVGPKEIGALVQRAFEDERSQIRRAIEEQVRRGPQDEPIQLELVPANLKATSESLPRVMAPLSPMGSDHPPPNTTGMSAAFSPPRPRSVVPAIAAGVTLALGALALVIFLDRNAPADGAATSTANEPATAEAKTAQLTVRYPEGATLKFDGGAVMKNPFVAEVAKDGSMHQLLIEQDGFEPARRTLVFDRDHDLTIELVGAAAPEATGKSTAAPVAAGPRGTRGPRPTPTATAAATSKPVEDPDAIKRKPPKASVEIDENNPYKK